MIKEVIVVEGKNDIAAVRRAVEAECLATGGFGLSSYTLEQIKHAYERRGIIILTDPDSAGERIRRYLSKRFPEAKHAFIPKEDASDEREVGIEVAAASAIRSALETLRSEKLQIEPRFTWEDMTRAGLHGAADSAARRAKLGRMLGIGYANAKTFFRRLNTYGVTREEFVAAREMINTNVRG